MHQHKTPYRRHIHLIDCVPSIIHKIQQQYPSGSDESLSVECINAEKITLSPPALAGNKLFIIAGVGGETAVTIASAILEQNPALLNTAEVTNDFIFSTNNQSFELRRYLRQAPFDCIAEDFVSENGQHHEHLHMQVNKGTAKTRQISLLGHDIWQPLTPEKRIYLNKQQQHYQRCWKLKGTQEASCAALGYLGILNSTTGGD